MTILDAEDYARRINAAQFGLPSEEVRPLIEHDRALRAERDALRDALAALVVDTGWLLGHTDPDLHPHGYVEDVRVQWERARALLGETP